jgi:hypothetical protein
MLWSSKKTPYLKTLPLTLKCFLLAAVVAVAVGVMDSQTLVGGYVAMQYK